MGCVQMSSCNCSMCLEMPLARLAQACSYSGMKYYGAVYATRIWVSGDEENAIIIFIEETAGSFYSEVVRGISSRLDG